MERLSRSTAPISFGDMSPAPARIVHLGLGAFHRAHQAWYTDVVDHDRNWGISSFTGRKAQAAIPIAEQDGLFTLITRSAERDDLSIVRSIVSASNGAEPGRVLNAVAHPDTALVTLTVTESGYRLQQGGKVDVNDPLYGADIKFVRELSSAKHSPDVVPATALGRLLAGLELRRLAQAPAIAIVPCDNMPSNGRLVHAALEDLAAQVSDALVEYVAHNVSCVSTSVDRITPAMTADDLLVAKRGIGLVDLAPVVTEPYADWVLCGEFPSGRPAWEEAGATFVDDIGPFETRKLWLLNGAHSLLAYSARARGHQTVDQAISDRACVAEVQNFWVEAATNLPPQIDVSTYTDALLTRFANPRIAHQLDQIANDGSLKLAVRVAPILKAELAQGRDGAGSARAIAAWIECARHSELGTDPKRDDIDRLVRTAESARAYIALVDEELASSDTAVSAIEELIRR